MLKVFFAFEILYRRAPLLYGGKNGCLDAANDKFPCRRLRNVAAKVHAGKPVGSLAGKALLGDSVVFRKRLGGLDSVLDDFRR